MNGYTGDYGMTRKEKEQYRKIMRVYYRKLKRLVRPEYKSKLEQVRV